MSTKQQTLKAPISFSGKGLHTGVKVTMTVNPAEVDTGIVFRRTDLEGQPIIPALCDYVVDTSRGTTIESGGHRGSTIEHIMSALWTLGVDNAVIDIDAGETPIMDGSACAYAKAITEVGITDQPAEQLIGDVGLRPVRVGGLDRADLVDAVFRLWIALAIQGGRGRRLGFQVLTPGGR